MSKHHISNADTISAHDGYHARLFAANGHKGVPMNIATKLDLGSPIAIDLNYIMDGATSTELPNTETVTYTTADDGTTPFDNADTPAVSTIVDSTGTSRSVWALDVPRAIVLTVTHGSAVVAMTTIVSGYDVYGVAMTELLTTTAGTTSKTATGAKAFSAISSIAITAAGDAEANTASLGITDKIGLPYALQSPSDVIQPYWNDALDTPTVVAAVATTATNATGDVRGTVTPGTANDGSSLVVWAHIASPGTEVGLVGVTQA